MLENTLWQAQQLEFLGELMFEFAFTKKSRLDPKVTIDISLYLNPGGTVCKLIIDTMTLSDDGFSFKPITIEGFSHHYDYNVKKSTMLVGILENEFVGVRIPW